MERSYVGRLLVVANLKETLVGANIKNTSTGKNNKPQISRKYKRCLRMKNKYAYIGKNFENSSRKHINILQDRDKKSPKNFTF